MITDAMDTEIALLRPRPADQYIGDVLEFISCAVYVDGGDRIEISYSEVDEVLQVKDWLSGRRIIAFPDIDSIIIGTIALCLVMSRQGSRWAPVLTGTDETYGWPSFKQLHEQLPDPDLAEAMHSIMHMVGLLLVIDRETDSSRRLVFHENEDVVMYIPAELKKVHETSEVVSVCSVSDYLRCMFYIWTESIGRAAQAAELSPQQYLQRLCYNIISEL